MEKQLFCYQRQVLLAEKSVRDAHEAELKQAKKLWRESITYPKRDYPWALLIKSNADELWVGLEQCSQFMN